MDAERELFEMAAAGKARRLRYKRIADHAGAAADALVENRERVAHTAVRSDGNQHRRVVVDLHVLPLADELEALGDVLRRNTPEVETLAAREDRRQQLVHLGRRQNEDHVRGRLLQRFQKRVEGRHRKHVHLVDDVHAVFGACRRKVRFLNQGADAVDAVVARRVDLHNVEDRPVVETAADRADAARVAVLRVQAVDGLGKNLRAGRLTGSARTRKQVRVRNPPRHQLVFQRDGHLRLADHIRKKLRPVFSVQRLIQAASSLLCLYKPKARRPFVEYVNGQATCIAPDDPLNAARSPA